MKVLTREGCITERYIAEEAVELCTEHLPDVSTVRVSSSQNMGLSKPLSSYTVLSELNGEDMAYQKFEVASSKYGSAII
ncbi:unnamed protein product [Prunus armeniaca]